MLTIGVVNLPADPHNIIFSDFEQQNNVVF